MKKPVLAEEAKKITFQGIPWGSTREETFRILTEDGLITEQAMNDAAKTHHHELTAYFSQGRELTIDNPPEDYEVIEDSVVFDGGSLGETDKIAGYQIRCLGVQFACCGDESALVSTTVMLDADDMEAALSDWSTKLTSLYGENLGIYAEDLRLDAWKGENKAVVMLAPADGCVALVYGTLDAENILDDYYTKYLIIQGDIDPADLYDD